MMHFGLLRADLFSFVLAPYETLDDAARAIGLDPRKVDHGMLAERIACIVYEFGLRQKPQRTFYASINGTLIPDKAVLYAINERGETVDLRFIPAISYYGRGASKVERAIQAGAVKRPSIAINNRVLWEWPQREA